MIIKHQPLPGQSEWLRFDENMALSRREASLRPACARHSRDHFVTVSVRPKLPPLCVPVSPSQVSREDSRDLWRSIGPSTMVVFKLRTSRSAHQLRLQKKYDIIFMFKDKRPLYFRHFRLDETAKTDVSDQRGRKMTSELHALSLIHISEPTRPY